LRKIIETFCDAQIIWIGILPASVEYENKLPGISNNINRYNHIIQYEADFGYYHFLNTNSIIMDGIMIDHHLNSICHKWLFDKLIDKINIKIL